jgi:hypothetical protein
LAVRFNIATAHADRQECLSYQNLKAHQLTHSRRIPNYPLQLEYNNCADSVESRESNSHGGVYPLHSELPMDRAALLLAEVQILGTLCTQAGTLEQRNELAHTLDGYAFLEPEHQIVFGSIRALLPHDRISNSNLAVHLNNRGFPDVDLEKYCAAALANIDDALRLARRLCLVARGPGADARYDSHGKAKHET